MIPTGINKLNELGQNRIIKLLYFYCVVKVSIRMTLRALKEIIMRFVKALWTLMDGKKTSIGGVISTISSLLILTGYHEIASDVENIGKLLSNPEVISLLVGITTQLVGIAHKIMKMRK